MERKWIFLCHQGAYTCWFLVGNILSRDYVGITFRFFLLRTHVEGLLRDSFAPFPAHGIQIN